MPWKATCRPRARHCTSINAQLIAVERTLILPDGLPGRPWYRNQIYAPGLYTGYGVKTLPGVRESIEQKQWKLAEEQAVRVGKVLENAGEKIQSAAAAIGRTKRHARRHAEAPILIFFRVFRPILSLHRPPLHAAVN